MKIMWIYCRNIILVYFFISAPCHGIVTIKVKDTLGATMYHALITLTNERTSQTTNISTTDISGISKIDLSAVSVRNHIPVPFSLGQNYPNPFNPSTTIPFNLTRSGITKLIIYNELGQNIHTLVNEYLSAGKHTVVWDGRDDSGAGISAGVYIYQLSFGEETITRKMLLMDGNNMSRSAFLSRGHSPAAKLLKPTADTFTINITAKDIEPFKQTGITLRDGETYEFTVHLRQDIIFVTIPGGTFQMGDGVGDLFAGCRPVHWVTVSSFQMSEAEITNSQYCGYLNEALLKGEIELTDTWILGAKDAFKGQNYICLSDTFDTNNRCWIRYLNGIFNVQPGHEIWPVVCVAWHGAKAFAECYGWDLPREAEFEYACQGGKQYVYGTNDGVLSKDKANCSWNIGHPVDVKGYPSNPFGLYDMSGNVYEWCSDWFGPYSDSTLNNPTGAEGGSTRIIRGGTYTDTDQCRSAYRHDCIPEDGSRMGGFRVVRR